MFLLFKDLMNCFSTDNDEARPGGVRTGGELTDPYLRAKVVRLCWLSWLAPSLVVKVRPSGCGEESSSTSSSTANNNCLFCLSLQLMLKTTPLGFFSSWTFGSDSHWLGSVSIQLGSPAEHSTDEATRKKSRSLFGVAESETAVSTC